MVASAGSGDVVKPPFEENSSVLDQAPGWIRNITDSGESIDGDDLTLIFGGAR